MNSLETRLKCNELQAKEEKKSEWGGTEGWARLWVWLRVVFKINTIKLILKSVNSNIIRIFSPIYFLQHAMGGSGKQKKKPRTPSNRWLSSYYFPLDVVYKKRCV